MSKYGFKKKIAAELLPQMMAAHPEAFFGKDSPETRPLKIGIKADLVAAHPEVKPFHLGIFLGEYANKTRYLRALIAHATRVDLQGVAAGVVKVEHRQRAQAMLNEREQKPKRAKERDPKSGRTGEVANAP